TLANRHFAALLRVDPDYSLDPFLAPPPALRAFETVRAQMVRELAGIREAHHRLAEIAAQEKQARAETDRHQASQRAQLEAQARLASTRQASAKSWWVDFIPFGAGQFQQGRTGVGIAFATSEIVLLAASLASFFTYNGLFTTTVIPVNNQGLGGDGQL